MKPGVYRIPSDEYRADKMCPEPSLSRSIIKELIACPAKAWLKHPRLNPAYVSEEKTIFDIGTISHALLLEGMDKATVIDAKDWKTVAAREARDEARAKGEVPILPHQHKSVQEMVKAADEQLAASDLGITDLRKEGDSELSYIWEEQGIWMKARPDWIIDDRTKFIDYKSTGTIVTPEEYNRIVVSSGLDIQDAFYSRGINYIERSNPEYILMVQEISPPYLCAFMRLDPMFKEMGEQKVAHGIGLWRYCLKNSTWPGYTGKIQTVSPKPWHLADWEQKQAEI